MIRVLIAAPLALFLSLLFFYLLALTVGMKGQLVSKTYDNPSLDFLMVRQESDIEIRKRQLPPEPEEVIELQQPEIPQIQAQNSSITTMNALRVDVMDITMDTQLNMPPNLQNLLKPSLALTIDMNPTVLRQISPRYPQRALRSRQQGKVVVEFVVTESGSVKIGSVVIVESTPLGVFDKAVLSVINRWRFKTREQNGQPVSYKARHELEFKLDE